MIEHLYNSRDLAFILNVNPQAVWRWVRAGKLRAYRFGVGRSSRLRIPESAVREFLGAPAEEHPVLQALRGPLSTVTNDPAELQKARRLLKNSVLAHRKGK